MDFIINNAGKIGLLFFFLVFIGVVVWLYAPGRKKKIEKHKEIPFKENDYD